MKPDTGLIVEFIEEKQAELLEQLKSHRNADEIMKIIERPLTEKEIFHGKVNLFFGIEETIFALDLSEKDVWVADAYFNFRIAKANISDLFKTVGAESQVRAMNLFNSFIEFGIFEQRYVSKSPQHSKAAAAKNGGDTQKRYYDAADVTIERIASGEWPNKSVKHHGDMVRSIMKENPDCKYSPARLRNELHETIKIMFPDRADQLLRIPNLKK